MNKKAVIQEKKVTKIIHIVIFLMISLFAMSNANAKTMSSGWTYPTGSSNTCGYLGWLGYNSGRGYHLAQDICSAANSRIYSIGKGEILKAESRGGYGCSGDCSGGTVLARYQAKDGTWFTVLYGHVDKNRLPKIGSVKAGDTIGYTASDWNPPHLHFSIHSGKTPASNWYLGYTENTANTYGFVDPLSFLNAHAMKKSTSNNNGDPNPVVTPAPYVQPVEQMIIPIINNLLLDQ